VEGEGGALAKKSVLAGKAGGAEPMGKRRRAKKKGHEERRS